MRTKTKIRPTRPTRPIRMRFEQWMARFRPVQNHLEPSAACEGLMFETYGRELDFVTAVNRERPATVWTVVETDNGKLYVTNGFHFVNRFAYFVSAEPCPDGQYIESLYA
jgi:hypothetical protein